MVRAGRADSFRVGEPVPVLIASGCPAYARGLSAFLESAAVLAHVTSTTDAALAEVVRLDAPVAVVDHRLADGPGVDLVAELHRRHPRVNVLFAAPDDTREAQARAVAAGACGVILWGWSRDLVVEAVADALHGVQRVNLEVVRSLAGLTGGRNTAAVPLTGQERVVLRLMRQHLTYKEIAAHLGVSWHTVRTHAQSILRKTGVHSRRDLMRWDDRLDAPASPERAA